MTTSTRHSEYFQRNRARIYLRRKAARVRAREESERTAAALWLIRSVLDHVEPERPVNHFRPMPVRRPLLTLKGAR